MNVRVSFQKGISIGVIALIIGLVMVFVPYESLKNMLFISIGITIAFLNIFPCVLYWLSYQKDGSFLVPAIMATVSVAIGFVFIFWHNWAISIILALWLIVFPIVRICNADNKMEMAKKQIAYFVIAALLFFVPADSIFEIVIKVFGAVIMVMGLIDIIYSLIAKNKNNKNEKRENSDSVIIDAKVEEIDE